MTLRMYAARKGWELATIEVDVRYDVDGRRTKHRSMRTITFPPTCTGEQRDRLADIAERTPVTLAIRNGTPITTTLRGPRRRMTNARYASRYSTNCGCSTSSTSTVEKPASAA